MYVEKNQQRENFFMTRKELTKGENKFTLQRKSTELQSLGA